MRLLSLLVVVSLLSFWQIAHSEDEKKELIGQLSISDILIQPRFYSTHDRSAQFDLDRSYFFFSWKMDRSLSAHFGVGEKALINQNTRLHSNTGAAIDSYKNLSFFEAYGQLDSLYGTVRAGLVPLMFGWEGGRRESDWIFPRTLFMGGEDTSQYATQNIGLRDYGVQYSVSYKKFYTVATLHNGENGPDQDGMIWHTGRVGWKDPSGLEIAASFSNGRYKENSNIAKTEKYSYANLFGSFEFYNLMILLEGSYGRKKLNDVVVPTDDTKFWGAHLDLSHPITQNLTGLFRYEQYDGDSNLADDRVSRYIIGLSLSNEFRTSSLYLWAIKNKEQSGVLKKGSEWILAWKVRSLSIF